MEISPTPPLPSPLSSAHTLDPPYEKRDALKFLIHDLQHLEKFQDDTFYHEQVGFASLIAERQASIPFHDDAQYREDLDQ